MRKVSVSAALAAGLLASGLSMSSANAADLGGDCCADLEERVAELEATTVRKGNRKVSLTISGWVAEQIGYWDDGTESNVYVTGIGYTLRSHFKMTGQANITPGWSAGYILHVEVNTADPALDVNQNRDDGTNALNVLQSAWFVKSDTLGKLTVGQQSHASDNAAILVDGSGSLVPANWVHFDGLSFLQRTNGVNTGLVMAHSAFCNHIGKGFAGDCHGDPTNAVRYDSPTFAGFSMSASWGEDDFWDATLRYAGEFGGIKIAAVGAYSHFSDDDQGQAPANGVIHRDSGFFQAGLYLQHVPTGLFAYGAYGKEFNENTYALAGVVEPDGTNWYVKAGLRQKFTPLGATVFYGEYSNNSDMFPGVFSVTQGITGSDLTQWGVGVVQEIDAAAMSLWLSYRNIEAEYDCGAAVGACAVLGTPTLDIDTLHVVKFGALISF